MEFFVEEVGLKTEGKTVQNKPGGPCGARSQGVLQKSQGNWRQPSSQAEAILAIKPLTVELHYSSPSEIYARVLTG